MLHKKYGHKPTLADMIEEIWVVTPRA